MILTHGRGDHELVIDIAADGARLGLHRGGLQVQPVEDPEVGVEDQPVRLLHGLLVHIERVGVGHDQLAGAQQAEARSGLIPELTWIW